MIITVPGARVNVLQAGQGADVLLLHGWGCSMELWRPYIDDLSRDYRVTALDFPAFGESPEPDAVWGVPEYAACVRVVMEQLTLQAPCAICHSFGARVGLLLASDPQPPFSRLALTGAAGIRPPADAGKRKQAGAYARKKRMAAFLYHVPLLRKPIDAYREKLVQRYGSPDYRALNPKMRQAFNQIVTLDLSDRLPDVSIPTLLLWGTQETETPYWMAERMQAAIPDCGLVPLQNGSHFAYLEQSAYCLRVLRAFLNGKGE